MTPLVARLAADLLLCLHLAFVAFVVLGGLMVLRWPRLAWVHLPAAVWGALVELAGWYCPLTNWENRLLRRAGDAGYEGGFVDHYLVSLLYPPGLERWHQMALGVVVIALNIAFYLLVLRRRRAGAAAKREEIG